MTITGNVPVVARKLTNSARTLLKCVGLLPKLVKTPEGRLEADSVTLPLKPPTGVTVIVLVPAPPRATVKVAGDAESEKPGDTGDTVSWMAVE